MTESLKPVSNVVVHLQRCSYSETLLSRQDSRIPVLKPKITEYIDEGMNAHNSISVRMSWYLEY